VLEDDLPSSARAECIRLVQSAGVTHGGCLRSRLRVQDVGCVDVGTSVKGRNEKRMIQSLIDVRLQFLVLWRGYDKRSRSWVCESEMTSDELIEDFAMSLARVRTGRRVRPLNA
jgi:hypothetical protein